jgi:hypothetical protein
MTDTDFAIAIFPFLKTSEPVRIGGYNFRPTEDIEGLPPRQAKAIGELAEMLFAQDDLRVKSASYAILPNMEVHSGDRRLTQLADLRDVVAYLYATPHDVFEHIFLSPEDTSLALFTLGRVSVFLTRPEHHTQSVAPKSGPEPDAGHQTAYDIEHLARPFRRLRASNGWTSPSPPVARSSGEARNTDILAHLFRLAMVQHCQREWTRPEPDSSQSGRSI